MLEGPDALDETSRSTNQGNHMRKQSQALLAEETGWEGYCKAIALGEGYEASCAKLVVRIGGNTPGTTVERLRRKSVSGVLNSEQVSIRSDAIDKLIDMFDKGLRTHTVSTTDYSDWKPMIDIRGNSCGHQRVTHFGGGR